MEILDSRLLCCDRSGVGDTTVVECGLGVGDCDGVGACQVLEIGDCIGVVKDISSRDANTQSIISKSLSVERCPACSVSSKRVESDQGFEEGKERPELESISVLE